MDEENKQITGNGVYSYGEPAGEPEEKAENIEVKPEEKVENTEVKPEEPEEKAENIETKPEESEEKTENVEVRPEEPENGPEHSDQSQTESTDSQENKFAYQDNHYDYSQQYNQSSNQAEHMDNAPMDLKDWILTLIVLIIPCVGIVMYFVWAFSKEGNINRRNFCRAQLIIFAALLGIYLILVVLFGAVAFTGAALY